MKLLPGFGPDNWTSELRQWVQGFTPYTGESVADITYHDYEGALTAIFYNEDQKEEWMDQWPTYYLEVKTTSRGLHEAFHMSRAQVDTVRINP